VTTTKRILIFAYFFPPLGGAGVQRVVKLAKYLPELGWEPTIVTVRARDYWMLDASLQRELGPAVRITRTRSLTGLSLLQWLAPRAGGQMRGARPSLRRIAGLRRLAAWALLPDSYVGWVPFAQSAGARLLRAQHYNMLMTTSSPDSAHLIGRGLARRFGVPWVADFRDPWTQRLSFAPPSAWHRARQRSLERSVLREASLVTVTAEETRADYLRRNPDLAPGRIAVVTNGYDEADFAALGEAAPPAGRMRILHAGQLNPERPARPFLEGLRRFLDRTPHAARELQVDFIGPHYARDLDDVRALDLTGIVRFETARPHAAIIDALCRSHLLLLIEHDSARGGLILPGKIFEYLRARRPILALVPPGAAWSLITRMQAGSCCRTDDHEACAQALGAYYESYAAGRLCATAVTDAQLHMFERRALARRFVELIEERLGRDSDR
jgi:hypothetical protein